MMLILRTRPIKQRQEDLTHALGVGLLWKQEACQHCLSRLLVNILLESYQRLCLILSQPDGLEFTRTQTQRQVLQPANTISTVHLVGWNTTLTFTKLAERQYSQYWGPMTSTAATEDWFKHKQLCGWNKISMAENQNESTQQNPKLCASLSAWHFTKP